MTIDQDARDKANAALAQIDAHEDICAIRYQGIQTEISGMKRIITWAGAAAFSVIIGMLGFLARAQFDAVEQMRRDQLVRVESQQNTIDLLQEQLRHESSRRNP